MLRIHQEGKKPLFVALVVLGAGPAHIASPDSRSCAGISIPADQRLFYLLSGLVPPIFDKIPAGASRFDPTGCNQFRL